MSRLTELQANDYAEHRAETLRDLYGVDPAVSIRIAKALYPETDDTPRKYASEYVMSSMFPNLAAAFSAYQASKDEQDAHEYAMNAGKYPALYSTQPQMLAMQQQAMYGGGMGGMGAAPPVHHRRHRRHHG